MFAGDLVLQLHQAFEQRFRTRRTTGDVNVNRQKLIDSLEDRVGAIHAAGRRAGAHGDDPFWLRHLFVNAFYRQRHFVGHRAGHDHDVALPRRKPHHFGAEPRDVETRGRRGH